MSSLAGGRISLEFQIVAYKATGTLMQMFVFGKSSGLGCGDT